MDRPPPPAVVTLATPSGFAFELVDRHPDGQFVAVTGPDHRLVRRRPGWPAPAPI